MLFLCVLFNIYFGLSSGRGDYGGHRTFTDYRSYSSQGSGYDDIVHPCATSDLNCIRHFFAQNSDCVPRHGPVPDPFVLRGTILPIPHANITYIVNEAYVSGLNEVKIKEFYVNTATGNLVMEMDFPYRVICKNCIMRYHVQGGEHEDRMHDANFDMDSYSTTLVVPVHRGVQMSRRQLYHSFKDPLPSLIVSPSAVSSDPVLSHAFHVFMKRLDNTLREGFGVVGSLYFDAYFNNHVCDFSHQRHAYNG